MTGELYTCVRCNKKGFIPAPHKVLPKGWTEASVGILCNLCAETYDSFISAFVHNRDFTMYKTEMSTHDIIEKEVTEQDGSEQAPEKLEACVSDRDSSGAKLY